MRKITPSPLNKICAPWHIPCWTINLSLLSLSTTRPFTVKRKEEGGRSVVALSALYVSTDEETGWEKTFTCGHTREPGESSHYEPCSRCRLRDRGGEEEKSCEELQMTVHYIKWEVWWKHEYVMCRRTDEGLLKKCGVQGKKKGRTERREWGKSSSEWKMSQPWSRLMSGN